MKLPGVKCHVPKGTIYLFPDIRGTGKTSREIFDILFNKAHIAALSGAAFGKYGEGFLRLSFGSLPVPKIKEAIQRMKKVWPLLAKVSQSRKSMAKKNSFKKRILVSITGKTDREWQNKMKEINRLKIPRVALFLEFFNRTQKKKIYRALLRSQIKEIPLVHVRNDMTRDEFAFLIKNFGTRYFTIHEDGFKYLGKWQGFHKKLFLEMNYDGHIAGNVKVKKIGGFCIDLSHFKAAEERWKKDFQYILRRNKIHKYFGCNHLNGFSYKTNSDLHTVKSSKDFDYLKTLPKFLFGKVIALEVFNGITDQLKFKKYLEKFLK